MFARPFVRPSHGNIPGARNPDNSVPGVETSAAAVSRAQARKNVTIKGLVAKDLTAHTSITKDEMAKLQQEDTAVRKENYEIKE